VHEGVTTYARTASMRSRALIVACIALCTPAASLGLPAPVRTMLPLAALADTAAVVPLWKAVRKCFPTEETALAAVAKNKRLLYPWVSCVQNIEGSYRVLVQTCGEEGTLEVISKNPGVLCCDPTRLARSSPDEIRGAANLVDTLERVSGAPLLLAVLAVALSALASGSDLLPVDVANTASAVARPTLGLLGAAAFVAAAANAAYASSKAPSRK